MSATDGSLLWAMFGQRAAMEGANAVTQASADRSQGRYEASALRFNSRMAGVNAADALARGREDASDLSRSARRLRSDQAGAYAGQGVDLSTGTPSEVMSETDRLARVDLKRIQNNAWREAYGFRAEGAEYLHRAEMAEISSKFRARSTLATGGMRAAQELLSGYVATRVPSRVPSKSGGNGSGSLYEHRPPYVPPTQPR